METTKAPKREEERVERGFPGQGDGRETRRALVVGTVWREEFVQRAQGVEVPSVGPEGRCSLGGNQNGTGFFLKPGRISVG